MTLPAAVESAIIAHALAAAPEECCGLLLGRGDTIVEAVRTRNSAEDRTRRYRIDPRDHFAALRHARQRSLEIIGAYHSHPRLVDDSGTTSPAPSPTDVAEAFSNFVYMIVGVSGRSARMAAFQLIDGNFVPVPFVRVR